MLKVELHTHTSDDPVDYIPHTVADLVDHAAKLGYQAVAITLHERQLDVTPFRSYAAERGIVLIPGLERSIEGRHVLLLNFRRGAEDVQTFEDLARLRRRERGLVVAPHPYFPARSCLGAQLDRHAAMFDAVERNAMFTSTLDFNARAERWAARQGKPVVGNCDVHRLRQLGPTYSLVDAEPDPEAICASIAAGRVTVESTPLTWFEAAATMTSLMWGESILRVARRLHEDQRRSDRLRQPDLVAERAEVESFSYSASDRHSSASPRYAAIRHDPDLT
jgi:predicted metal-dependent phosphoesterase TrpH